MSTIPSLENIFLIDVNVCMSMYVYVGMHMCMYVYMHLCLYVHVGPCAICVSISGTLILQPRLKSLP